MLLQKQLNNYYCGPLMKLTWERGLGVRNKCNYPISYHEHRCDGNATVQLTVLGGKHILSLMLIARQKKGGDKFAKGLPTRAQTPSMNSSTILHGLFMIKK
ncbi:hypothetical protein AAZV13_16G026700 [Glycine max]